MAAQTREAAVPRGPEGLGAQGIGEEDRAYRGSRYREVRDALFENPYYDVWGGPGKPPLPVYPVTLRSVLTGILPFGQRHQFLQAARRAVASDADLRWGADGKGFRRLLHPSGVCLFGRWQITEPSEYTGYFRQGSEALIAGRWSSCCTETRRGHTRSLSMVGKLWPTTDPDHPEPLRTANFYSQQDLGGEKTPYINDVITRNAPDTHALRRGLGAPIFLLSGVVFILADRQPSFRQVYPIAELGKPPGEATRAPEFMRLRVAAHQPRIEGDGLDLRDEVLAQIYDAGDPQPKRTLTFEIDVTDDGTTKGIPGLEVRTLRNWRHIGRIVFHEAVASYNGDHVVHFPHPPWREDRNDPGSVSRKRNRRAG